MARNLAYYMDPEEEARKRALIEEQLVMGPPPPPPNLGVAPVPRVPIDMTTPRRTDGSYADFHDAYQDEEPTAEELAADEAADGKDEAEAGHPLDVLLDHDAASGENPYDSYVPINYGAGLGGYATRLDMGPLARAELAAGARLAEAPAPVDKTSASVSAEQKGVPASRLAERAEAVASEPPPPERDSTHAVDKVAATPQRGERTDFFGLDDEEGFSRQKQIARVGELYGEGEAPSHHWEDELLRERGAGRLTDDQIRRRAAAIGFFQGPAFGGDPGAGSRWAAEQHAANRDFYGARERARAQDAAGQRISRGMAEAIAASGQMSPEAAVNLRRNDDAVRTFGQFASQGGRAEGQQIGLQKEKLKIMAGLENAKTKAEYDYWHAKLVAFTQLGTAEIYANKGQATTPEAKAINDSAAASVMAQALGEDDPAIGARALANDFTGLSAKQRGIAMRLGPQLRAKAAQNKGLDQVLNDSIRTQATQPIKDAYSIGKSIELAKNNRQQRTKFKTDWNDASIAFKEAWQGWKSLSPDGKAALAEWAAGGWTGKIRSFLMQPGDQERIAAVQGVINALVKDRSGSAVTGSEWERIATEIGLTADDWNPFNKPEAIEKFLKISGDKLTSHRRVFEQEYGWKPREADADGR